MKILDCEQGGMEWKQARLGIPTASRFGKILTPKTRQYSKQSLDLRLELVAEWRMGAPLEADGTYWMDRGTELEPRAIEWYEFTRGVTVERVGFCARDDGLTGCSPDGLVGDDGGIEIKCPSPKVHMKYLLGIDDPADDTQVQGNLWITGREWWDVISFCPGNEAVRGLPPVVLRKYRDEDYIADIEAAVNQFLAEMLECREQLDALGDLGRIEIKEAA